MPCADLVRRQAHGAAGRPPARRRPRSTGRKAARAASTRGVARRRRARPSAVATRRLGCVRHGCASFRLRGVGGHGRPNPDLELVSLRDSDASSRFEVRMKRSLSKRVFRKICFHRERDLYSRKEITDAGTLRALAHPLRTASDGGAADWPAPRPRPSWPSGSARVPANCSWHLRLLAKHGYIEEAGEAHRPPATVAPGDRVAVLGRRPDDPRVRRGQPRRRPRSCSTTNTARFVIAERWKSSDPAEWRDAAASIQSVALADRRRAARAQRCESSGWSASTWTGLPIRQLRPRRLAAWCAWSRGRCRRGRSTTRHVPSRTRST